MRHLWIFWLTFGIAMTSQAYAMIPDETPPVRPTITPEKQWIAPEYDETFQEFASCKDLISCTSYPAPRYETPGEHFVKRISYSTSEKYLQIFFSLLDNNGNESQEVKNILEYIHYYLAKNGIFKSGMENGCDCSKDRCFLRPKKDILQELITNCTTTKNPLVFSVYKSITAYKKEYQDLLRGAQYQSALIIYADLEQISPFLAVFSDLKLIPETFIRQLMWHMDGPEKENFETIYVNIEKYKINTKRIINDAQKQIVQKYPRPSASIVLEELNSIGDQDLRATVTWGVIQNLKQNDYFYSAPEDFLYRPTSEDYKNLCALINKKDLPFYTEARRLVAGELSTRFGKHEEALTMILDLNDPESSRERATYANCFLGADTLQTLDVSTESILMLVNLFKEKKALPQEAAK